jgi:type VI secretion system secreted protein VgrG
MPSAKTVVERVHKAIGGTKGLPLVRYAFELAGAETQWRVRKLELREGVSELYECVLDLANDDLDADLTALEGASCVVKIERGPAHRRLCGLVFRVEWLGTMVDHLLVRVHVRPALAALGQGLDSRIFQEQSVQQILQEVLSDGLEAYERTVRFNLDRTYQPREYCTQYGESDLDFALRLMSEEGIFFFFDHSGEREELVLVDLNQKCPEYRSAGGGAVPVVGPECPQELLPQETVGRLRVGREMRSTGVVLRDFDWTRPRLDLTCPKSGPDSRGKERSIYEYSPHVIAAYDSGKKVYTRDEGALRARLRKEELDVGTRSATGESNITGLTAGCILEVEGQDLPELGTKFLVVRVEHEGDAAEEIQHQMEENAGQRQRYRNRFICVSFDLPYRSPLLRRPVVAGPQTATVVGPAGEEIYTDEHGRVKAQFHWDREGKGDEQSSCWMRVMQGWAGPGFGSVFLPRIGMEVVVQFLEGNTDRPLVVGCVYNGVNPAPIPLPHEKTKTSIKTRSSPDSEGFNELTFEDAAGMEEISIHAQKDLRAQILNNQSHSVGNNDSVSVGANQKVSIGANQTIQVGANRSLSVGADESIAVGANQTMSVGANRDSTISAHETLAVGGNRTKTIGGNENITISGKRNAEIVGQDRAVVQGGKYTKVKGARTDVVTKAKVETVTLASTLQVGLAYAINVGAAMNTLVVGAKNTTVFGANTEEAKGAKVIIAGKKLTLKCGASQITLDPSGVIQIVGPKGVKINGETVDLNCDVAPAE